MNIDKKIEDLRKEFNEKVDELKREYKEKNEKWIPEVGDRYYFIDEELNVDWQWFDNDDTDEAIFKNNKIFKTEEEAQEYADYLKARKEYSYEFSKEEWEEIEIKKYFIYYNYEYKRINVVFHNSFFEMNCICFKTEEKAEEFIDKYKKQILKFEFGIEEE